MKKIIICFTILATLLVIACDSSNESATKKEVPSTTENQTKKSVKIQSAQKRIVFFGNSLSAGYGVDPEDSFVGLIESRVDSLDLSYKVINAGNSGETSAGGNSRIDWILKKPVDIFILELGGNDALRGIEPKSTLTNLQSIIDKTREKYPEVQIIIAGMLAPPNMGAEFTDQFKNIFPQLAKENDALLIPFLLDGVGGIPSLNLADGIHPNPQGHKIVTENVWSVLKTIL